MTTQQAMREARKRWGKAAFVEMSNHGISSPEKRAEAHQRMLDARVERAAIQKELEERLAACDWYQDLTRRKREAYKRENDAQSEALYQRFSVGRIEHGIGFIKGSGDTFREAFAKADGS